MRCFERRQCVWGIGASTKNKQDEAMQFPPLNSNVTGG